MGAFAEVARHDPRPAVADAAAAALVEVVQAHCRGWDAPSWQAVHVRHNQPIFTERGMCSRHTDGH